jgi:hypothetical protein
MPGPDLPNAPLHVETFYAVRSHEPIRIWCRCGRNRDHDTFPPGVSAPPAAAVQVAGTGRKASTPAASPGKPQ